MLTHNITIQSLTGERKNIKHSQQTDCFKTLFTEKAFSVCADLYVCVCVCVHIKLINKKKIKKNRQI